MIKFFSSWVKTLGLAIVIVSILEMLLPNNKTKKYIRMVMGIYILFTIIVKILNSYSFNKFNEEELKKIDLITNEKINNDNFNFITSKLKDYILNDNPKLNYFIEKNNEFLNIKIKTYNLFNNEKNVKLKKMKNISIVNDVFSI